MRSGLGAAGSRPRAQIQSLCRSEGGGGGGGAKTEGGWDGLELRDDTSSSYRSYNGFGYGGVKGKPVEMGPMAGGPDDGLMEKHALNGAGEGGGNTRPRPRSWGPSYHGGQPGKRGSMSVPLHGTYQAEGWRSRRGGGGPGQQVCVSGEPIRGRTGEPCKCGLARAPPLWETPARAESSVISRPASQSSPRTCCAMKRQPLQQIAAAPGQARRPAAEAVHVYMYVLTRVVREREREDGLMATVLRDREVAGLSRLCAVATAHEANERP